ncbi:MAG TPA: DUF5319 family protein [Actinomycetota bacterium]|nr:DUF5319 family protein [Actinomycetota bacterium]
MDPESHDEFDDEPLDEDERDLLKQDLVDVKVLKELLEPRGIKGAVFYCPDCDEDHYLAWDLLAGNLEELLEAGQPPVHEPAFEPNAEHYVSWDYARGFLDGYESYEEEEIEEVDDFALRLVSELGDRGWRVADMKSLLVSLGLELPEGVRRGQPEDGPSS